MRRAFLLALLLLSATTVAARAEGSLTIGLADDGSTYVVERMHPGDTVNRHVRVGNTTPDALTADVYVGAATNGRGRFQWGDGRAQNALTRWTAVRPPRAQVPPQRAVDIEVTIRVPDGATPRKHYAVVWAELPRSDSGVVNRVGVRIYLTVMEPPESNAAAVAVAVAVLLLLAISVIAVAARRRGTGRGDSTAANP